MSLYVSNTLCLNGKGFSHCGYCENEIITKLYLECQNVTYEFAEELLLNGWRRCRNIFYQVCKQPEHCIERPVILECEKFVPSKSQRRVLKKFNQFITGKLKSNDEQLESTSSEIIEELEETKIVNNSEIPLDLLEYCRVQMVEVFKEQNLINDSIDIKIMQQVRNGKWILLSPILHQIKNNSIDKDALLSELQSKLKNETRIEKVIIENNFINVYTIFPKSAHSKLRSKKSSKKPGKSESTESSSISVPTESSSIPLPTESSSNSNEPELPPISVPTESSSIPDEPELPPIPLPTESSSIPEPELPSIPLLTESSSIPDEPELPPLPSIPEPELPPIPDVFGISDQSIQQTKLRIEIVRPSEDEEVFALFCKFQSIILHDDDNDMDSFMSFLGIDFLNEPGENEGLFWIKWYFDKKLFAVSVLDIYPTVVSSVYFFYDPDYLFLSPGIWSAMQEIEYAKKLGKKYYSLGLYIHECPKMRYKGKFAGTKIFCNETRKFYPFDDRVKAKLEEHTLCIAPSEEEYEKAMKEKEEKVERIKENILFIMDIDRKYFPCYYSELYKNLTADGKELMDLYLPMLPDDDDVAYILQ